jgi:hypothetical protein
MERNWKDGKKDERRHVRKSVDRQKKEISEVVIEFANHDDHAVSVKLRKTKIYNLFRYTSV